MRSSYIASPCFWLCNRNCQIVKSKCQYETSFTIPYHTNFNPTIYPLSFVGIMILGVWLVAIHSFTSFWNMLCCFLFSSLHVVWRAFCFDFASTSSSPLKLATLALGASTKANVATLLPRCVNDQDGQFCGTFFACA